MVDTAGKKFPALGDWLTASDVADELHVSRQSVNRMITRGEFKTVKELGKRPIYVVRSTEVAKVKARRASG